LTLAKILSISQIIGGFVKVDFSSKIGSIRRKFRALKFWVPFWILPPYWISEVAFKRIKIFFGLIFIEYFKVDWVGGVSVVFSEKLHICRHSHFRPPFWIFEVMKPFLNKISSFLKMEE
jgi:hypothetical protein